MAGGIGVSLDDCNTLRQSLPHLSGSDHIRASTVAAVALASAGRIALDQTFVPWSRNCSQQPFAVRPGQPKDSELGAITGCRRGEVTFYEDLESVADSLRILLTKRADALLQLGEGMEVIVRPRLISGPAFACFDDIA